MTTAAWSDPDEPPASDRAERALLGALMTLATAAECPPTLRPEDFRLEAHRLVYAAMLRLEADESSIDLVTVVNALEAAGKLEKAGGAAYVASLEDRVPDCDAIRDYARIVRDASKRRKRAAWAR